MRTAPEFRVRYLADRREYEVFIPEGVESLMAVQPLGLRVVHESGEGWETWRLLSRAASRVDVTSVDASMGVDLKGADALFLNGYNSWTDSVERNPFEAMPGLAGVPRPIVNKWSLDGSGDYRFTREDARPGRQHGFGYGYVRHDGGALLFGSLCEDSGYTTIREDLGRNLLTFQKEAPARPLEEGEERELISLAVVTGTVADAFGVYLDLAGIVRREAPRAVGYSSWYRHYGNIDAVCLGRDLDGFQRVLGKIQTPGVTRVFQVDDGYTKVGDWLQPDPLKFPEGLAPVASRIAGVGFVPGLWMAPFVCERESRLFSEHPDWIMRDGEGAPVTTGCHWSGGIALDTRNEEVREYVRQCLGAATREWGFRLLKLDFLYAACMIPHDGLNRGELMADALNLMRASVPEGTRFDLCGVPMVSAFGRCEYCRVGCDVGLDWDDKPYMRLLHRERVSTKNSLANTRGRAHLNGRAFWNDPDVFFLRKDVQLTDEQREELLQADVLHGGVLFTSDDMGAWDEEQMTRYRFVVEKFCDEGARLAGQA